jgi:hypothetical protein
MHGWHGAPNSLMRPTFALRATVGNLRLQASAKVGGAARI